MEKEFDIHNGEEAVTDFYEFLLTYTWFDCIKKNPGTNFETYLEMALRSYCEWKWGTGFPK